MAKPKQPEKPASRAIYGVGFLKAPDGNIVVVRGLMDLAVCESLSPTRVDAEMGSRPTEVFDEPDNMGHVARRVLPMDVKLGEHRVYGQRSDRSGVIAKRMLGLLLERAIHAPHAESPETLDELRAPSKRAKPHIVETKRDKRIRAERAMDLLGKPDAEVRRTLLKAGRSEAQVVAYLRERAA